MARLWDSILRRSEKRSDPGLNLNDWAMMYQGNSYPLASMYPRQGNHEEIESSFEGYVRGAYKSCGPVFACMVARMSIFTEARFQFQRLGGTSGAPGDANRPGKLFGTKALALLENPWPNGTTGELLARAIQDVDLAGNFFVVEEGDRLRRLRPDWVEIVLDEAPELAVRSNIVGYVYKPGGYANNSPDTWEIYPVDGSNGRVAHWSPIPDPTAQYMGMSWLTPVLREMQADKAATKHKGKFFDNAATPNLAVTFSDQLTVDQFNEFMQTMNAAKGGTEHAYETLYLGGGATVSVVGSDLRQLDFKATQGAGETRIAAAAQVPAVIVGFSEGMQGSSLNAGNYGSAKKAFGDRTLRPLWRSFCAAMEAIIQAPPSSRLWYDDRDISFLRTDRKELADIQHVQQQTIVGLVMNGYTPDSAVQAVMEEDFSLLKHTGLFSVQLLPPDVSGQSVKGNADTPNAAPPNKQAKPATKAPGLPQAKTPTAPKKPARDDGSEHDE
jgi:phage portal protein BeeE